VSDFFKAYDPNRMAEIIKSPKEKNVDAARKLYAKEYMKKGKTAKESKGAMEHAYGEVEKKHGKEMLERLKSYHDKNQSGDDESSSSKEKQEMIYRPVRKKNKEEEDKEKAKPTPHGIKPNIDWYKKGGKISTAEHGNSKHKHCW